MLRFYFCGPKKMKKKKQLHSHKTSSGDFSCEKDDEKSLPKVNKISVICKNLYFIHNLTLFGY